MIPRKIKCPLSPSTGPGAGTITRRRSNSQPIGRDAIIATSGAATALTRNSSLSSRTSSPLRSPSTSNNMTAGSPTTTTTEKASSPTPSRITQKLLMVQEEETPSLAQKSASAATKLSASQRFQQRVREAAKNGDLVTQKRKLSLLLLLILMILPNYQYVNILKFPHHQKQKCKRKRKSQYQLKLQLHHKEELEIKSPVIILNVIVIYQCQRILTQNLQTVQLIKRVAVAIIVLEVLVTQLQPPLPQPQFPKS